MTIQSPGHSPVSASIIMTGPVHSSPLWVPLCYESHCACSLWPVCSASRCYITSGIGKESRRWRLDGARSFTLEHGLSFEPALPEQRPRTISCGARPSVISRAQHSSENVQWVPSPVASGFQVGVAPYLLPLNSSPALLLCT